MSLVSFAVKLFPASNPARQVTLHQIHRQSGQRIRYQKIVPDLGPVEEDEIVKGYEFRKGEYVPLESDELKQVKLESQHTIDIVQFVDADEIDPIYYDKPYFLVPDDAIAAEAFAVIREALRASNTVGLGEVVLSSKEHLVALSPCADGMLLETLRYADEVRRAALYFEDIPKVEIDDDQLALARELIQRKKKKFDPSQFSDRYEDALRALIARKVEHKPLIESPTPAPGGGKVINLMDALKRSLGQPPEKIAVRARAAKRAGKPAPRKPTPRPATRRRKSA